MTETPNPAPRSAFAPDYAVSPKPLVNKYLRKTPGASKEHASTTVDVYAVLEAFDVRCPGLQHALKKLLCTGIRGHKDAMQDLLEARQALDRAIELQAWRDTYSKRGE